MTYSSTNSTTDPGNGLPWVNVVDIQNGSGATDGSGVYLGNQFVLTANHVGPVSQIDIGGMLFYVDTSFNASYSGGSFSGGFSQIGSTDLKLVRLTADPASSVAGLKTVVVNTSTTRDVNSITTNYIVGYGESKGTAITGTGTNGWNWAAGTAGTEQWGTNNIFAVANAVTPLGFTSTTNTLVTQFNSTALASEAAAELEDSGGAMFFETGTNWFLSGITLYVSTNGASYTQGDPVTTGPSQNFFGRLSDYATLIDSAIAIPEPSSVALIFGGAGLLLAAHRRWARTG